MITRSHPSPTHGHQVTSLTLHMITQSFMSVEVSVHLACTTPPLAFLVFDEDVCRCFAAQCTAVDTSDRAWHQARLSLSRGGLGLSRGGLGLSRGGLGLSRGGLGLSRGGLGLSRGGLGLRSLTQHSPAAYITSLCSSGFGSQSQHHLASAIHLFCTIIRGNYLRGTSVDSHHPKEPFLKAGRSSLQSSSGHILCC